MPEFDLPRRLVAEALGTALLKSLFWQHLNARVLHRFFEHSDNDAALSFTGAREVVEEFVKDFIRSDQSPFRICQIESPCCLM